MGIINRTKEASEQRIVFDKSLSGVATGVTHIICGIPYPATLDGGQFFLVGISGAPTYQVSVERFIVGAGFTTIVVATGSSNTPPAFGTSGVVAAGMKIAASGSTLLNLQANDILMLVTGGSNAAAALLDVQVAIRPLQDVKVAWGIL